MAFSSRTGSLTQAQPSSRSYRGSKESRQGAGTSEGVSAYDAVPPCAGWSPLLGADPIANHSLLQETWLNLTWLRAFFPALCKNAAAPFGDEGKEARTGVGNPGQKLSLDWGAGCFRGQFCNCALCSVHHSGSIHLRKKETGRKNEPAQRRGFCPHLPSSSQPRCPRGKRLDSQSAASREFKVEGAMFTCHANKTSNS